MKQNKNKPMPPNPPLDRIKREGSVHFCEKCGSSMSKNRFFGLLGQKSCHNKKCSNHK